MALYSSYDSISPWRSATVSATFHHGSNQRLQLVLAFLGIWTSLVWAQLSNLPDLQRGLVCFALISNVPQPCQPLHMVCSSLRISPKPAPVIVMVDNFILSPASALWRALCPRKHPQELWLWGVFSIGSFEDEKKPVRGGLLYLSHIIHLQKDLPQSVYV